jgi:hypothetical protein
VIISDEAVNASSPIFSSPLLPFIQSHMRGYSSDSEGFRHPSLTAMQSSLVFEVEQLLHLYFVEVPIRDGYSSHSRFGQAV